MKEKRNNRWRLWIGPCLVAPALLAGCLCRDGGGCGGLGGGAGGGKFIDKCADIPQGAIPQPIGTHTNTLYTNQVNKAEMDQFVIYLYEWQGDTPNFGPFGARHIDRLAARLPQVTFPVIIEPDCDAGINEARRLTVVAYLEQHGNANAGQVVRLGYPIAEGIYGDEAQRIYRQMIYPRNNNNFGNRSNFQGGNQGGIQGGFGGGQLGGSGGY
jgi:hypothetical protein